MSNVSSAWNNCEKLTSKNKLKKLGRLTKFSKYSTLCNRINKM